MVRSRRTIRWMTSILVVILAGVALPRPAAAQCDYEIIRPDEWQPATYGFWQVIPSLLDTPAAMAVSDDLLVLASDQRIPDPGYYRDHEPFQVSGLMIFRRLQGEWKFETLLLDPKRRTTEDLPKGQEFGAAVAIQQDRLLAAAPTELFLYHRVNEKWAVETVIRPEPVTNEGFYTYRDDLVWIDDEVIASAYYVSPDHESTPVVLVLREDETGWSLVRELRDPEGDDNSRFGSGLERSGDRLAIGAPAAGQGRPGRIDFYGRTDGTWVREDFISGTEIDGYRLGHPGMSLVGDTLVAATPSPDDDDYTGALHIIERDADGTWSQTQRLPIPVNPDEAQQPGPRTDIYRLDFDGERIVVVRPSGGH